MNAYSCHTGLASIQLFWVILGALLSLIIYRVSIAVYDLYLHPLARAGIPFYSVWDIITPWPAIFSSLLGGQRHVEVHKRQLAIGAIMRTGRDEVVLSDPKWSRFLMGSKLSKTSSPHHSCKDPRSAAGSLFSTNDYHTAAGKRRAVVPIYSQNQIGLLDPEYQERVGTLLQVLKDASKRHCGNEGIDVIPLLLATCIDLSGRVTLGVDLGTMAAYVRGEDTGMSKLTEDVFYRDLCKDQLPSLVWTILRQMPFARWQAIVDSDHALHEYYTPFIKAAMARPAGERPCTAQKLQIAYAHHVGSEHLVIEECKDHMIVAPEPARVASYALWLLAAHPAVQAKLVEAIRSYGLDEWEVPTVRAAGEMEYLSAVVKETLRLYPASPGPRLRVVTGKGMMVGEQCIPAGTAVGVQVWTSNRSEQIWGPDAAVFRPERFMDGLTPEQIVAYSPFSSGNRTCAGQYKEDVKFCLGDFEDRRRLYRPQLRAPPRKFDHPAVHGAAGLGNATASFRRVSSDIHPTTVLRGKEPQAGLLGREHSVASSQPNHAWTLAQTYVEALFPIAGRPESSHIRNTSTAISNY